MAALTYRAGAWGRRLTIRLATIVDDIRELYCRRSVVTTIQELVADGHIEARSNGKALVIWLGDFFWGLVQKCKNAQPNIITANTKKTEPRRAWEPYRPSVVLRRDEVPLVPVCSSCQAEGKLADGSYCNCSAGQMLEAQQT
jgi:hypothetical protein